VTVARPARDGATTQPLGLVAHASVAVPADPVLVALDLSAGDGERAPAPAPADPGPPAPPAAPPVAPVPPAAPVAPSCSLASGGVQLRRSGAEARIGRGKSRTRPVRVGFCSDRDGKVVVELGRARRGGGLKKVLARAAVRVAGGRGVSAAPRWSKGDSTRLRGARPAVRVRFRPAGARHDVVLVRPLDAATFRRR
jgi:hypothetical protein